jgi:hypothetical protein
MWEKKDRFSITRAVVKGDTFEMVAVRRGY